MNLELKHNEDHEEWAALYAAGALIFCLSVMQDCPRKNQAKAALRYCVVPDMIGSRLK
jgi:hypothetical protein